MSPATIATLSSGEFVGIVADDPTKKMQYKAFHATIKRDDTEIPDFSLPVVRQVDAAVLEDNFQKVKADIKESVKSEMKRILADPSLKHLVIKR